jgi:hypothetical protein
MDLNSATSLALLSFFHQLPVIYDQIPGAVFSDAAHKAIVRGKPLLIKENWRDVFEPDNVMEQIMDIT